MRVYISGCVEYILHGRETKMRISSNVLGLILEDIGLHQKPLARMHGGDDIEPKKYIKK